MSSIIPKAMLGVWLWQLVTGFSSYFGSPGAPRSPRQASEGRQPS